MLCLYEKINTDKTSSTNQGYYQSEYIQIHESFQLFYNNESHWIWNKSEKTKVQKNCAVNFCNKCHLYLCVTEILH